MEIQKAFGAPPGTHGRAVARENVRVELQVDRQVPELAQSGKWHSSVFLMIARATPPTNRKQLNIIQ